MTAKKMADIFFGKFSELITSSNDSHSREEKSSDEISANDKTEKKSTTQKIYIYVGIGLAVAIIAYLIF